LVSSSSALILWPPIICVPNSPSFQPGYYFTYPLGFHRFALCACFLFLLHGSFFFLTRFELPAAEELLQDEPAE
jgi:hypothetical protein